MPSFVRPFVGRTLHKFGGVLGAQVNWNEANKEHLKVERRQRGTIPEKDAYTAAMKALQDRYHEQVGKPCGLLRDGPKAERLSTVEYDTRKKTAKKMAVDIEATDKGRTRLDHEIDMVHDIKAQHLAIQDDLSKRQAEFDEGLDAVETLVSQLENGDATISDSSIQMQNPPRFLKCLLSPDKDEGRTIGVFRRLLNLIVRIFDDEHSTNEVASSSMAPEL